MKGGKTRAGGGGRIKSDILVVCNLSQVRGWGQRLGGMGGVGVGRDVCVWMGGGGGRVVGEGQRWGGGQAWGGGRA